MKALIAAFLIFIVLPFTQILPLGTYNQPYAFMVSIFIFLIYLKKIIYLVDINSILASVIFIFSALLFFILAAFDGINIQEIKYLLMYLTPVFVGFAVVCSLYFYKDFTILLIKIGLIFWILIGGIQTFISPDFLTFGVGEFANAAEVVVESGRGVISLAAEPTHFGFHILLLSSFLLIIKEERWIYMMIILGLLFSASSSTLLVVMLSFLFYFIIRNLIAAVLIMILSFLLFEPFLLFISNEIFEDIRVFNLINAFIEEPTNLLFLDHSLNARLGGLMAGISEVWNSYFMPHGMSISDWMVDSKFFLYNNDYLWSISPAGIPSGIVIIIYQIGIFALPFILLFYFRLISLKLTGIRYVFVITPCIIFLFQLSLATPTFGLVFGALIYKLIKPDVEREPVVIQ